MDGEGWRPDSKRTMERSLTLSIYEVNPFVVPSSSQSSAAAMSSAYDTLSGGFNTDDDGDSVVFPTSWPPVDSQEEYADGALETELFQMIDELMREPEDQHFGYPSSEANSFSFMTSHGGTTASASWENPVLPENQINEEDAVDSLPQPPYGVEEAIVLPNENRVVNNHVVECQKSEISRFYLETTINNDEAFRPSTSADPQTFHNEETSQPDEMLEIDNRKRKYEMSKSICPLQPKIRTPETDYGVTTPNSNIYSLVEEQYRGNSMKPGSYLFLGDASRPSSSAGGQSISPELCNSHVRLKINSFTVPEFFVVVPETENIAFPKEHTGHYCDLRVTDAFVGNSLSVTEGGCVQHPAMQELFAWGCSYIYQTLHKAIAEKLTDMIGIEGNFHVVLHGEEIKDNNGILPKSGIFTKKKLDVVAESEYFQGFNGSSPHHSCIPLQPQTWLTPSSSVIQGADDTLPDSFMSLLGVQDHPQRLEYQTDGSIANGSAVSNPALNGFLDLVPENQKYKASKCKKRLVMDGSGLDVGKSKSSANTKRRKTKFFKRDEVEALVQKVDELGIGSWQKIKEQAFGKDSRRTYMDVKDKWRSLVKTANRPVQRRRGDPLPQGLLDRVRDIAIRKSQSM